MPRPIASRIHPIRFPTRRMISAPRVAYTIAATGTPTAGYASVGLRSGQARMMRTTVADATTTVDAQRAETLGEDDSSVTAIIAPPSCPVTGTGQRVVPLRSGAGRP